MKGEKSDAVKTRRTEEDKEMRRDKERRQGSGARKGEELK